MVNVVNVVDRNNVRGWNVAEGGDLLASRFFEGGGGATKDDLPEIKMIVRFVD